MTGIEPVGHIQLLLYILSIADFIILINFFIIIIFCLRPEGLEMIEQNTD